MEKLKTVPTIVFIFLGILASIFIFVNRDHLIQGSPQVFSKQNMLESLWYHYKQEYMEPSTLRVLDKAEQNITTSEGESYAMLRAVWMNDKSTFDISWKWTKDNLGRPDDHLSSWLFGQREDGSYGVLTERGGHNTATDADVDFALALLFASHRWNDGGYKYDAEQIIKDIWEKEVVIIQGRPYLLANNIEKTDKTKNTYLVNPSYFAPYAYRIFATVDTTHPWLALVDTSYELLNESMGSSLDKPSSVGLPPNWIFIDKTNGQITSFNSSSLSTDFSYDALRIPWRIELDRQWFGDERAVALLKKFTFLEKEWETHRSIYSHYSHDGVVIEKKEVPAMYGGTIGAFMELNPSIAADIYKTKLEALYDPDSFNWKYPLGYYDANIAWFGLALYNHLLPNLYDQNI